MGFWISLLQVLETEVQIMMDLIGKRRKISVTSSPGKHSQFLLSSDIAASKERETEVEVCVLEDCGMWTLLIKSQTIPPLILKRSLIHSYILRIPPFDT